MPRSPQAVPGTALSAPRRSPASSHPLPARPRPPRPPRRLLLPLLLLSLRLAVTFASAGSRLPALPGARPSGGDAPSDARRTRAGPGFSGRGQSPRSPRRRRARAGTRAAPPAPAPRAPARAEPSGAEPSRGHPAREAAARSPGELAGAGSRAGDAATASPAPSASPGGGTTAAFADKAPRPVLGSLSRGDPTCAGPRPATWGRGPQSPFLRILWAPGPGVASRRDRARPGGGRGGPGVWNRGHRGPGQPRVFGGGLGPPPRV